MKSLLALMRKEYREAIRTGRIMIIILLFVLFGIMSPAVAKLTPWMMEMLSDSMAETGLIVTNVQVDALTSWMQFFKNIPIALTAFVLMFSDIFTKEYNSGTLSLVLTKGLSRYKVVIAKTVLLLSIWIAGYGICFTITYGFNEYFGITVLPITYFLGNYMVAVRYMGYMPYCAFSSLLRNNTGVTLCIGGTVLLAYLLSILPKVKTYSPTLLMNTNSLLIGVEETDAYIRAIVITASLCIVCVAVSIPILNKRQL